MIKIHLFLAELLICLIYIDCANSQDNNGMVKLANEIHDKILTIDTHTDTPLDLYYDNFDLSVKHDVDSGGSRVDFPRMKEGGLDAVFFAAWIAQGPRTPENNKLAQEKVTAIIQCIRQNVEKRPKIAELAFTPKDAYRIEKKGKRAVYIGIENGYAIGDDLSFVRKFFDMGARYITLCHTKNNDICDSSTDSTEFNGLAVLGEDVIREMNRLGMLVDVSHISDSAFYDVLKISKVPVIASHSCARAVCNNPRNLTDDMLRALAKNGGVIQMCILSEYIKEIEQDPERTKAREDLRIKYNDFKDLTDDERKNAWAEWHAINEKYPEKLSTVSDVVDHIDHVVKIAGIDHVGIGTDFDGGGGVNGCRDVSEMRNITLELVKRGYTREDIRKIWGGNFMRVFAAVQEAAGDLF